MKWNTLVRLYLSMIKSYRNAIEHVRKIAKKLNRNERVKQWNSERLSMRDWAWIKINKMITSGNDWPPWTSFAVILWHTHGKSFTKLCACVCVSVCVLDWIKVKTWSMANMHATQFRIIVEFSFEVKKHQTLHFNVRYTKWIFHPLNHHVYKRKEPSKTLSDSHTKSNGENILNVDYISDRLYVRMLEKKFLFYFREQL